MALKSIKMDVEKDGFPVAALREIRALQRLRHDHILPLFDVVSRKDMVYLVLEYMEHDLMGILSEPSLSLEEDQLKAYMLQLMDALACMHRHNVVHRDLKCARASCTRGMTRQPILIAPAPALLPCCPPTAANLLINNQGQLKLADFGLARTLRHLAGATGASGALAAGNNGGGSGEAGADAMGAPQAYTNRVITLWYRPPELLLGATFYGTEVDMWSAGCILPELFARKPLLGGSDDELGQLANIFHLCGSPEPDVWPDAQQLPWMAMVRPRAPQPRILRQQLAK